MTMTTGEVLDELIARFERGQGMVAEGAYLRLVQLREDLQAARAVEGSGGAELLG